MKRFMMRALLFSAITLANAAPAWAAEYLVKYRSHWGMSTFSAMKIQVLDQHDAGQLLKVNIPEAQKLKTLVDLVSNPNVEYVVPNAKVRAFSAPVDATALKEQYALARVQAERAWQRAGNRGSRQVKVAVIDTGVDYRHNNLAPNMIPGYDFAGNDADPMDETSFQNPGHGTHCAGVVGATGLVDDGIIGLSPEVSMMPLRFLDKNGSGDLNNAIKAIDYAIEKKMDIISASWGAAIPRSQAQPLIEAIERANQAGIIFVVAAANDGKNNDSYEVYPANAGLANTISVAASNSSDAKPSWSNYGRAKVDISAPGDAIMSTLPGNKFGNLSGTSMATPLVAGLVALLKAQDPTLTPGQMRSLIQSTGAKVGIQTACDCRIDAFEAVETVMSKKMFISPFAATVAKDAKLTFSAVYGTAPFTFASSNPAVASIDAQGVLTALTEGETTVTVTDSTGATSTSHKIYVGKPAGGGNPGDPGNPGWPGDPGNPGNPGDCPLGDPMICEIICQIQPDLPFCNK